MWLKFMSNMRVADKLKIKYNMSHETWKTKWIVFKMRYAIKRGRRSTEVCRNLSLGEIGWLMENGFKVEEYGYSYLQISV